MKININEWTRAQFLAVPKRKDWREDVGEFDSLVLLPTRRIHDSGYRCLDFVAVNGGKPFCRLSGHSDVIHIDGIGGYGKWTPPKLPRLIEPKGWNMDCLRKSGLFRLWCSGRLVCDPALSSFKVYGIPPYRR